MKLRVFCTLSFSVIIVVDVSANEMEDPSRMSKQQSWNLIHFICSSVYPHQCQRLYRGQEDVDQFRHVSDIDIFVTIDVTGHELLLGTEQHADQ